MSMDSLYKRLGGFGKYQWRSTFVLALFNIAQVWQPLVYIFVYQVPDFVCNHSNFTSNFNKSFFTPGNSSVGECKVFGSDDMRCKDWSFDSKISTVTEEFRLICDRSYLRPLTLSIVLLFKALAVNVSGYFGDRFGRKTTIGWISLIEIPLTFCILLTKDLFWFTILMVIINGISTAKFAIIFITGLELAKTTQRNTAAQMINFMFSLGMVLLTIPAYIFRKNWRHFVASLGATNAVILLTFWYYPVSLNWLISKHRIKQAKQLMLKISSINGVSLVESECETLISNIKIEEKQPEKNKMMEILRNRIMMKRIFASDFSWFLCSLVYYAITLNLDKLHGNIYWNNVISGILQIPVLIFTWFTIQQLGRIFTAGSMFFVSGILCCLTPIFPGSPYTLTILALVGNATMNAAFCTMYIISVETFPTTTRARILGICSASARVGAFVSPYIMFIGELTSVTVPFVIMGVLSILAAAIVVLFLPETTRSITPINIGDALKQETLFKRFSKKIKEDKSVAL